MTWMMNGIETDARIEITWRELLRCAWDKLQGRSAFVGAKVGIQVRTNAPVQVLVDEWQLVRGRRNYE